MSFASSLHEHHGNLKEKSILVLLRYFHRDFVCLGFFCGVLFCLSCSTHLKCFLHVCKFETYSSRLWNSAIELKIMCSSLEHVVDTNCAHHLKGVQN